MKKAFEWDGKKLKVEGVTLDATEEYLTIAEAMNAPDSKLTPLDRVRNSRRMLEVLNCPADILTGLYAERIMELIGVLETAHWGVGDGGNPEGGE